MKTLLLLCTTATLHAAVSTNPIPTSFPAERYEALTARSPFALATPVAAAPAAPEKNFADGWYVSGLAQLDSKDFVTIKARDLSVQFSLFGNDPHDNGVSLQKVEWSPAVGRSTVTIAKDGQTAKLEFNQAELQSAPSAPPGMPPQPGMGRPPMPVTQNAVPRPGMPRPVQPLAQPIQQPQQQQQQQFPGLPNAGQVIPRANGVAAPSPDSRRRIRVINTIPAQ